MSNPLTSRTTLLVKVLPLVAVALIVKIVLHALGWEPLELNALFSGLVTASVFLLGFLLAGTLADYKESERIPAELSASINSILDESLILFADKGSGEARQAVLRIRDLTVAIRRWLYGQIEFGLLLRLVRDLNGVFLSFEPLTQPNFIARLKQEQSQIRRLLMRVETIRETSFVMAGYTVAQITSGLVILGLLLMELTPFSAALFFVAVLTFLLTYILSLIGDLDNPFDYRLDADGELDVGAVEVSLHALDELDRQIKDALEVVRPEN